MVCIMLLTMLTRFKSKVIRTLQNWKLLKTQNRAHTEQALAHWARKVTKNPLSTSYVP